MTVRSTRRERELSWALLQTLREGLWHKPLSITNYTTLTWSNYGADMLAAIAYPIPRKTSWDGIGLRIVGAGAAGAVVRLGIYEDGGAAYPGDLIEDYGTVVATSTGHKEITISPSLELDKGLYWVAFVCNDAAIDFAYNRVYLSVIGFRVDTTSLTDNVWRIAQAFGALPDPFPAGAASHYGAVNVSLKLDSLLLGGTPY